jgi:hypothetical protein
MKKAFFVLMLFHGLFLFADDFEERRSKFASEGFGFRYDLDENNSRTLFIKNHGNPIRTAESNVINPYNGLEDRTITLEYSNLIISFYEWNESVEGNFPESRLLSITSKDTNEYLFGIRHGMGINDLQRIFGEIEISDNSIWLTASNSGNVATIALENNMVKYIVWNYSLE